MQLLKISLFNVVAALITFSPNAQAVPCNALELRPHTSEINIGEPYTLLLNTAPAKAEPGAEAAPPARLLYSLELDNNPVQINVRTDVGTGLYGIMMKPFSTPGVKRFRLFTFDARPSASPPNGCDPKEIVIAATSITVLPPTATTAITPTSLSGLWWSATTRGQGIFFNQNYPSSVAFVGWFTYDAAGNAKWYVGDRCAMTDGKTCTTQLFETKGATFDGTTFNNGALAVSPVGEATFTFANDQSATMRYTLKGVAGNIDLVRQPF
jgi:hypothetical protein